MFIPTSVELPLWNIIDLPEPLIYLLILLTEFTPQFYHDAVSMDSTFLRFRSQCLRTPQRTLSFKCLPKLLKSL